MATKPSILICGASIAGPVLACFLSKAGIKTTIIERSPNFRTTGQQVDIRGPGLEVVRRMGLEEIVRSRTTEEAGLKFVDENNQLIAEFPVDKETGMSFSSDIEILRGELGRIFYDQTQESQNVDYIFGDHVTSLNDNGSKVEVELASGQKRSFDLVIGADGQNSKTRRLLFPEIQDPFNSLDNISPTSQSPSNPQTAPSHKMNEREQKDLFRELFKDAGREAERVLREMDGCEDWYMQEIGQVKMSFWHKGRIALLGDAAYCPSPISGAGTSLAIVGAYILAGEIVRSVKAGKGDLEQAFGEYENKMRAYVEKAQKLPPGAPQIANAQTKMGIMVMKGVLGFVYWSGLVNLFIRLNKKRVLHIPTIRISGKGLARSNMKSARCSSPSNNRADSPAKSPEHRIKPAPTSPKTGMPAKCHHNLITNSIP
ncbi:related to salicylate 1-monooxygenase [Phialocephala subalpina]|uniref:Related to salicylate 1-monooxygenase n=1 Tax=Phialocephala subalpina TaxID=576137 RepID=A0A1L7WGL3_9HELO|nr:related to salicylate 1-monooxygenase [Phialocephala subalpina]